MNTYIPGKIAEGATIEKFHMVVQGSNSEDAALAGSGGTPIGVAQNDPGDNEAVAIVATGPSFIVAMGNSVNIVEGDPLKPDSNGHAVKAETNYDVYGVVADEALTADDKVIRCHVVRPTVLAHS